MRRLPVPSSSNGRDDGRPAIVASSVSLNRGSYMCSPRRPARGDWPCRTRRPEKARVRGESRASATPIDVKMTGSSPVCACAVLRDRSSWPSTEAAMAARSMSLALDASPSPTKSMSVPRMRVPWTHIERVVDRYVISAPLVFAIVTLCVARRTDAPQRTSGSTLRTASMSDWPLSIIVSTSRDSTKGSKTEMSGAAPFFGKSSLASGPKGAVSIAAATRSSTSPGRELEANPMRPSFTTRRATPLVWRALISLRRLASKTTGVSSVLTAKASACWAPARRAAARMDSRSDMLPLPDDAVLDADVRAAVGDRQRHLAALAAAAALVEVEVVADARRCSPGS